MRDFISWSILVEAGGMETITGRSLIPWPGVVLSVILSVNIGLQKTKFERGKVCLIPRHVNQICSNARIHWHQVGKGTYRLLVYTGLGGSKMGIVRCLLF